MKKQTVTVAIPAYNEEKTILRLLDEIFKQKTSLFELEKVVVYSDGSTDNTVKLIKSHFEKVKVVDSKNNIGKNNRINQIMRDNSSDILIQADADIHFSNNQVFEHLIKALTTKKAHLICAYHKASTPEYFIEKLAYFGFKVWDRARLKLGKKAVRYYCEGGLRAFSNNFTCKFRIPNVYGLSKDNYSFYWAISNGFKVSVCKDAVVYIDLPTNYKDYSKQMKRFLTYPNVLPTLFDQKILNKYQTITRGKKFKALLEELVKEPILGMGYILLQGMVYMEKLSYKVDLSWSSIERK